MTSRRKTTADGGQVDTINALKFSTVSNSRDNQPVTREGTLAEFVEHLHGGKQIALPRDQFVRLDKKDRAKLKDGPAVILSRFDGGRTGAHVAEVTGASFDLDAGNPDIAEVAACLTGLTAVIHESASSNPKARKLRAFVPYSQPVGVEQHKAAWDALAARLNSEWLGGLTVGRDPGRLCYAPPVFSRGARGEIAVQEGAWYAASDVTPPAAPEKLNGAVKHDDAGWTQQQAWGPDSPDMNNVVGALRRIPPGVNHPKWLKVGAALLDGFKGSEHGFELFHQWASGELAGIEAPENYKGRDDCLKLWRSLKPPGARGKAVRRASLFTIANEYPEVAQGPQEACQRPTHDELMAKYPKDFVPTDDDEPILKHGSPEWLAVAYELEGFKSEDFAAGFFRKGKPAVPAVPRRPSLEYARNILDLMNDESFVPIEPYIEGLLYPRGMTAFYGKAKEGKSFALMQVACAAASGRPLWEQHPGSIATGARFEGFKVPESRRVLMLCSEDHGARLQKRFRELLDARKLPYPVKTLDLLLREDLARIAAGYEVEVDGERAIPEGTGLAIIDSLIREWAAAGVELLILDTVDNIEATFNATHKGRDVKRHDYQRGTFYDKLADELNIAIIGTGHLRKGKGKADADLDPMDLVNTTGAANAGISHFWAFTKLPEQALTLTEDDSGKERRFFATGRELDHDVNMHFLQGAADHGGLWVNYGASNEVLLGTRAAEYLSELELLLGEGGGQPVTAENIALALGNGTKAATVLRFLKRFKQRGLVWKGKALTSYPGPKGGWKLNDPASRARASI